MPGYLSHSMVGYTAGRVFTGSKLPWRFWILAIVLPALPDLDSIGFALGVPYSSFFGHRGFFHSPFFVLLLGLVVVPVFFGIRTTFSKRGAFYVAFFFLITASHGILDTFTSGGRGVALLSPFSTERFFAPWQPIPASPISLRAFFSAWGLRVVFAELCWIWLPCLVAIWFSILLRKDPVDAEVAEE